MINAEVKMGKIPSKDPLAYMMGFMDAMGDRTVEQVQAQADGEELAPAYLQGHAVGVAVKLGEEPVPEWVTLA